jgi:hypothetical protein
MTPNPAPARPRGWWRRNIWGLLVLPPVVALSVAVPFREEVYDRWFQAEPRVPVTATQGVWVGYAGARLRLVESGLVDQVVDRAKKPFTVPGAKVWRARVGIDEPNEKALGGCQVFLEDAAGRQYSDRPQELNGASLPVGVGCKPPIHLDDGPSSGPSPSGARVRFEQTYFFVLPEAAEPVAVRVEVLTQMPRYVRFTLR